MAAFGDYSKETGTWKLTGIAADSAALELTLADKVAGLVFDGGKRAFVQELGADSKFEDEPPASGGLLLALDHLRRLLVLGSRGFSEFYYLGSEPLDGTGTAVDVLFCERYGGRTHWYFSRATGMLAGFDTFRDDDVDPCEVRLAGEIDLAGRRFPEVFVVRSGDKEFGRFKMTGGMFGPPVAPAAAAQDKKADPKPDSK